MGLTINPLERRAGVLSGVGSEILAPFSPPNQLPRPLTLILNVSWALSIMGRGEGGKEAVLTTYTPPPPGDLL